MTANFVELWPIMYDALLRAVDGQRPDVMIVNIMTFAAMDVADKEGIPFIVNNPYLLAVLPSTILPPADDLPFYLSVSYTHLDVYKRQLPRTLPKREPRRGHAKCFGQRFEHVHAGLRALLDVGNGGSA